MNKSTSFSILKKSIAKNWLYLVALLILSVIVAVISAVNPIVFQKIIDDAIPARDLKITVIYVCAIAGLSIINTVLMNMRNKVGYKFSDNCSKTLRTLCFEKSLLMNMVSFDELGSQKLMNIITRAVGRITELYIYGDIVSFITNTVQFLVIIFILNSYDTKIALLSCFALPLLLLMIKLFGKKIGKDEKNLLEHLSNGEKFLLQCFYGIKTIKAYNGQSNELNTFNDWQETNSRLGWKIKSSHNLVRTILPNAISQIILAIMFIMCSLKIMDDKMTIGSLVAIISYVPLMISAINGLLSMEVGKSAISRLLKDIDNIINSPLEKRNTKMMDLTNNKPVFEFDNVEFSYDRGEFLLLIKSLKINKGDFLLVVGESGGGKTSITDIIEKFYDVKSGSINYYGENFSDLSPDIVRENISTILQDNYVFNKSIKENIIYPNTSSESIDEVLEKAQLVDFINSLPEKELTVINDFGGNFSGGECQRICLARALYKNSDILLFDEPTAALDAITSKKIFDMLKNESVNKNKTVIVITHDISKITYATNVAVVKDGSIVEFGTPNELLKNNSHLTTLYNSQQANIEDE